MNIPLGRETDVWSLPQLKEGWGRWCRLSNAINFASTLCFTDVSGHFHYVARQWIGSAAKYKTFGNTLKHYLTKVFLKKPSKIEPKSICMNHSSLKQITFVSVQSQRREHFIPLCLLSPAYNCTVKLCLFFQNWHFCNRLSKEVFGYG